MSTVTLSHPHCAITSAEKPDGIASQPLTFALPASMRPLSLVGMKAFLPSLSKKRTLGGRQVTVNACPARHILQLGTATSSRILFDNECNRSKRSIDAHVAGNLRKWRGGRNPCRPLASHSKGRCDMDLQLKGKVALITGPAKGMGAAITLAFAREGCDPILVGRDTDAIAPVADAARALGRNVMIASCDLTDTARCQAVVDEASATFGAIDILVNVAGGSGPMGKTGWETTRSEFDEIVTLNMAGCFNTMRAVLPGMIARRSGAIVNVGGHLRHARAGGSHGLFGVENGVCAALPNPWRWKRGRLAST